MSSDDLRQLAEDLAHDRVPRERAVELAQHEELREVAPPGSSPTEGRGAIDTRMVVRLVSSELLAAMLPAGLQLAPQPLAPPGRHPLLVSFAEDTFGAWFGAMAYHELMLAIPWVEYAEERMPHRGPFIYMPRLWLDETVPRVLGNRLYGFEKLAGVFTTGDSAWEVKDGDGDLLVRGAFTSAGPARPPDEHTNFAWFRRMLEQPTISQALRIVDDEARDHGGATQPFLCSTVHYLLDGRDWDGEPAVATVEPLRAELTFGNGLTMPGPLPQDTAAIPSLADHVLGAFRLRCKIVVSLPGSSARTYYPRGRGRKLRVAVIGGGPSGCAAAYWLARQRDDYEVDVYTMGWRLGGKCAGSRNSARNDRIEEHGLHAFLGFYENAFRTMRSVYADIGWSLDTTDGHLRGGFIPRDDVGVMDRVGDTWRYFPTPKRTNDRVPGGVPPVGKDPSGHIGHALRGLFRRIAEEIGIDIEDDRELARSTKTISRLSSWMKRQTAIRVEEIVETPLAASNVKRWAIALLDEVREKLGERYAGRTRSDADSFFRWATADVLLTIAIGVLTESTLDFDDLDDRDFRRWLVEHGLAAEHYEASTITQVYETLFAHATDLPYRFGDLACGVGLRWFLLLGFGFAGHIAWDFKWSCPETLVSPYMLALERHGARVHFFHRLTSLELDGDGDDRRLSRVRFTLQARVKDGQPYRPFAVRATPEGTPPVWPAEPDYDQLVDGHHVAAQRQAPAALESSFDEWGGLGERVLEQGRDFDVCILAVPIGALPPVVRALADPSSPHHDPRWQAMTAGISLVQTASAQLWIDRDGTELFDAPAERGLFTGFVQPLASVGQLQHLIAHEGWSGTPPRTVLYHTGGLLAGTRPPSEREQMLGLVDERREWWRSYFDAWLERNHRELFPRGPERYEDLLALLHVPDGALARTPADRLAAQWFNIACYPSDLYVLSRPGEMRLRMAPHESGVRFLMLAGDWTKTDLNCGCVEASTQSGMLVARALSGEPVWLWRVGF